MPRMEEGGEGRGGGGDMRAACYICAYLVFGICVRLETCTLSIYVVVVFLQRRRTVQINKNALTIE